MLLGESLKRLGLRETRLKTCLLYTSELATANVEDPASLEKLLATFV